MDLALDRWTDFNVAMVGATAALAGLVIVAASVNVADIVKSRSLTARLAAVIANLVVALAGCAIALIPDVSGQGFGIALMVLAVGSVAFHAHAVREINAGTSSAGWLRPLQAGVGFLSPVGFVLGGVLVMVGNPAGMTAFAVAAIVAIMYTLGISWIALIEVLR